MIEYLEDLAQTNMFSGINPEKIAGLLECVDGRVVHYSKDEMIIEEGSSVLTFGVMLSGHGRSLKWDASDRQVIITLLSQGSEIGVLLATNPEYASSVFVQALDDVSVLMIPFDRLLARCEKNCLQHEILLRNYLRIVAEKGLVLHERIDCLLKPTVRDKIMTYMLRVSKEQQSRTFSIPINRNGMSKYLNVERSALSRELSQMKRDGILNYHRNEFELL